MAKISMSQMSKLFHRLATTYTAGIDLRAAYALEEKTGNSKYRLNAKIINRQLGEGKSLAESMENLNGYFPDLAVSVVKAGERGGRLEESFTRLSNHYTALVSFRNKFLASIAWPLFELTFAILIVGLFIFLCDGLYSSMGMEVIDWFGMGSTAGNVAAYFVLVFLFFALVTFIFIGSIRGWFGTMPIRIAMRIPLVGKTIQCLALSRFAWTLSVAENAGMNAIEAAQLALRSTENYYYKSLETVVCHNLQQGHQFHKTFEATGSFPEELIIFIKNGEISGELAESMNRASAELQAKAEINLKAISVIGFVTVLMVVGALVLAILIFAMQAYINILNNASQL